MPIRAVRENAPHGYLCEVRISVAASERGPIERQSS